MGNEVSSLDVNSLSTSAEIITATAEGLKVSREISGEIGKAATSIVGLLSPEDAVELMEAATVQPIRSRRPRVAVLGSQGAGKSTYLHCILHSRKPDHAPASVGVDFQTTSIALGDGTQIVVDILDFAGGHNPAHYSIYLGSADIVVLVLDSELETMEAEAKAWCDLVVKAAVATGKRKIISKVTMKADERPQDGCAEIPMLTHDRPSECRDHLRELILRCIDHNEEPSEETGESASS